jgi:hypothetical protein
MKSAIASFISFVNDVGRPCFIKDLKLIDPNISNLSFYDRFGISKRRYPARIFLTELSYLSIISIRAFAASSYRLPTIVRTRITDI